MKVNGQAAAKCCGDYPLFFPINSNLLGRTIVRVLCRKCKRMVYGLDIQNAVEKWNRSCENE